jgi:succinate dehydrogenase / fumarate reductase cytochrome b subunit
MQFLKSTVGRKLLMTVTGFAMLGFVTVHLLGNFSVYAGADGINAYASKLQGLGSFVWLFRLLMLTLFSVHVFFGIQLTLENRSAKPLSYAVKKTLSTTFAGKNMIWTGLILFAFLIYHLLHFTIHITNPEISSGVNIDASGRPDVFKMVVLSFQNTAISLIYIGAMTALVLHLFHGIQSLFQTLGLNNDRTMPVITKAGRIAAVVIFLGYIFIPIVIFAGILKG